MLVPFHSQPGSGTAVLYSGFKSGVMRPDTNLIAHPPLDLVEVPRPVVTSVAPIYFMRNDDQRGRGGCCAQHFRCTHAAARPAPARTPRPSRTHPVIARERTRG